MGSFGSRFGAVGLASFLVAGAFSVVLLPPAFAEPPGVGRDAVKPVPSKPFVKSSERADGTDRVVGLPHAKADLPLGDEGVAAPASGWTSIVGTPVSVRTAPEATVLLPDEVAVDPTSGVDSDAAAIAQVQRVVRGLVDPELAVPAGSVGVEVSGLPDGGAGLLLKVSAGDPSGTVVEGPPEPLPSPSAEPSVSPEPTVEPSGSATSSPQPDAPASEGGLTDSGAVEVALDYGDFAQVYGGGWSDRLMVLAYPECYVTTPELPECSTGQPIESVNDGKTLSFTTTDLTAEPGTASPTIGGDADVSTGSWTGAGGTQPVGSFGGNVYAVSANGGSYGATPLNASSNWQVGPGSGEFTYAYPFELPAASFGPTPDLELSYSSGSVDGMTMSENGQATQTGLGWDEVSPGYISRSYAACADDGHDTKGDLCWKTDGEGLVDAYTLVLNGRSSRLVRVPGTGKFRLTDDPGWEVIKFFGGSQGQDNTDDNDEAFRVRTPDGTTYWFGWGNGTSSVFRVPVFGNDAGEQCHVPGNVASSWCQQAWQWNLDRVIDVHGNEIRYTYETDTNQYGRWGTNSNNQIYDANGHLLKVEYGFSGTGTPRHVVDLTWGWRCKNAMYGETGTCSGSNSPTGSPNLWPDVPTDLICEGASCSKHSPAFFSTRRLKQVDTRTVETVGTSTTTRTVDSYLLEHTLPDPDEGSPGPDEPDLWLRFVERDGNGLAADGTTQISTTDLPRVGFTGIPKHNLVEQLGSGKWLAKYRLDQVKTETGGKINVVYGAGDGEECDVPYVTNRDRWNSNKQCYTQKWAPPGQNPTWRWFKKFVVKKITLNDDALGANPAGVAPVAGNFATGGRLAYKSVKGADQAIDAANAGTRALVDAGKYDYLFGRVASGSHNAARSAQNAQQLARIGVYNNSAGRSLLSSHFDDVVARSDNIARTFTNKHGTFQIRDSLFSGPGGFLKLESTWHVTDDGLRLTTVIPMGGP